MHDNAHTSVPLHTCPDFFRWIHEDLRPWMETGITKEMVERNKGSATFRLVILDGRAYVENYKKGLQTRDLFTQWSLLQLLRRYPGKVPDLDFMFDSCDFPLVPKKDYHKLNSTFAPPPLFAYCGEDDSHDIVFPDWSFWGWAEINMEPWDLVKDLDKGNKRTEWIDREPYAYWKGNPWVAGHRQDLLKCNASETQDWNARLYMQDWDRESKEGFKQSHVGDQCTHRQESIFFS
nr:O-glucosyltransferase rumi homolog [Tanacetum cinerariifolium]